MKTKIEEMITNIDRILKDENPYTDWLKGRHSAFRGVKERLVKILNENKNDERSEEN